MANPQQVSIVVQAIFDNLGGSASTVDNIASALSNINSGNALTIVSDTGQVIASVVSVAAAVTAGTLVGPSVVVSAAAVAATITIAKNINETQGSINLGDIMNVVGNMATIAGAGLAGGVLPVAISIAGATFGAAGIIENRTSGGLTKLITAAFTSSQSFIRRDPLILDLDGDGIETVGPAQSGVLFDHDADGIKTGTGWVGKDDGLLVWDRNGNGKIDDGSELFGNNTRLANGAKAANGFAALAELDSNHDGKIDAGDAAFKQLRVWKDSDSNGVASDGELLTLDAAGVRSLGTAFTLQNVTDVQGNQHLQAGQFTRTDGSSRAMNDVWFGADRARTVDQDLVAVGSTIAALPELQGFGNVHSLHQAMARNRLTPPVMQPLANAANDRVWTAVA